MRSHLIIRFDDICPTMNWLVWDQIESILMKHDIKPILAVVPDNRDPKLEIDAYRMDFWERVRCWQARGWAIALHGYQHIFETTDSGLLGINDYSEFAGLPYDVQKHKFESALAVFSREGICADAWVAPAHTFDAISVQLLLEFGIRVISDGFYWRPIIRMGALWIPQQMWRIRSLPVGVWTVCLHNNSFSVGDIAKLETDIIKYKDVIVSLDELLNNYFAKPHGLLDAIFSAILLVCLRLKRKLRRLI